MDNEEIKKQAEEILDKFSKALEKIKIEEAKVERDKDRREEGEGREGDENFREIMFENAPKKKNEFIEAEKGEWTK